MINSRIHQNLIQQYLILLFCNVGEQSLRECVCVATCICIVRLSRSASILDPSLTVNRNRNCAARLQYSSVNNAIRRNDLLLSFFHLRYLCYYELLMYGAEQEPQRT